jgi:hypothetical protein
MTKEELIAKMAASAGITKVAAGSPASLHRSRHHVVKERAARLSGKFRHLYDFKAESADGQEPTHWGIAQNSGRQGPEVLCGKGTTFGSQVTTPRNFR